MRAQHQAVVNPVVFFHRIAGIVQAARYGNPDAGGKSPAQVGRVQHFLPGHAQRSLAADGFQAGLGRIKHIRKKLGLRCRQKRKFKATTNSKYTLPVAQNLLQDRPPVSRPNEMWVTDLTYIPTDEGWLYLAGIKDRYTCEIVGYALGERMTKDLVGRALFQAVRAKRPEPG